MSADDLTSLRAFVDGLHEQQREWARSLGAEVELTHDELQMLRCWIECKRWWDERTEDERMRFLACEEMMEKDYGIEPPSGYFYIMTPDGTIGGW